MTMKCPYCSKDCKPRGLKNHVRMSGGEHGESGTVPETFESDLEAEHETDPEADPSQADGEPSDSSESGPDNVTTVTPEDMKQAKSGASDGETEPSDGPDGSEYPFDPSDPDAIELDGGETMDIRKDGEILPGVEAEAGDYLLKTDKGPVLYDKSDGEMYEVLTA